MTTNLTQLSEAIKTLNSRIDANNVKSARLAGQREAAIKEFTCIADEYATKYGVSFDVNANNLGELISEEKDKVVASYEASLKESEQFLEDIESGNYLKADKATSGKATPAASSDKVMSTSPAASPSDDHSEDISLEDLGGFTSVEDLVKVNMDIPDIETFVPKASSDDSDIEDILAEFDL